MRKENIIEVTEEVNIGNGIILEKGDRIRVINEMWNGHNQNGFDDNGMAMPDEIDADKSMRQDGFNRLTDLKRLLSSKGIQAELTKGRDGYTLAFTPKTPGGKEVKIVNTNSEFIYVDQKSGTHTFDYLTGWITDGTVLSIHTDQGVYKLDLGIR